MSRRWWPGARRRALEAQLAAVLAEVGLLRAAQVADEARLLAAARPWLLRRAAAFQADHDHLQRPAHLWREGGSKRPSDAETRAKVAKMMVVELQMLADDELPAIMRFDAATTVGERAGAA